MSRRKSWRTNGIGSDLYAVVEAIVNLNAYLGGIWVGVPTHGLRVEEFRSGNPSVLRVRFPRWTEQEWIELVLSEDQENPEHARCIQRGRVRCPAFGKRVGEKQWLGFAFDNLANWYGGARFFDFINADSEALVRQAFEGRASVLEHCHNIALTTLAELEGF